MMPLQHAYRIVLPALLPLLFTCLHAHAQAQEGGANQVLLEPGRSIAFTDTKRPGVNLVVTAPGDAYIDLSRMMASSEKEGIFALLTGMQIKSAGSIVSNADGSLSLRPASGQSFYVPRDAAPRPGRITLEGGTAVLDRGQMVIHADRVLRAGVPVPVQANAGLPAMPVVPVQSTAGVKPITAPPSASITLQGFNVGSGAALNIVQPSGAVSINSAPGGNVSVTGNLSSTGNIVIVNPGGSVTISPGTIITGGSINISTVPIPSQGFGATVLTTGSKPPTTPVVVPTR
jgi:hypothetical protein